MGGGDEERAAYGRIRRAIAVGLAGLVSVVVIADVLDVTRQADPVVLGLLLGALLVLLGVEAGSKLLP